MEKKARKPGRKRKTNPGGFGGGGKIAGRDVDLRARRPDAAPPTIAVHLGIEGLLQGDAKLRQRFDLIVRRGRIAHAVWLLQQARKRIEKGGIGILAKTLEVTIEKYQGGGVAVDEEGIVERVLALLGKLKELRAAPGRALQNEEEKGEESD